MTYIFILCYRPPASNINYSISSIVAIKEYSNVAHRVCIAGDFDLPHIDWLEPHATEPAEKYLVNIMIEVG